MVEGKTGKSGTRENLGKLDTILELFSTRPISTSVPRRRSHRPLLWRAQSGRSLLYLDPDAGKHRISAEQVTLFVGSIRERLSVISLTGDEYADALQAAAALDIVGGGTYDALLAHCALKAKAQAIYTWNARHYSLCGAQVAGLLRDP